MKKNKTMIWRSAVRRWGGLMNKGVGWIRGGYIIAVRRVLPWPAFPGHLTEGGSSTQVVADDDALGSRGGRRGGGGLAVAGAEPAGSGGGAGPPIHGVGGWGMRNAVWDASCR